MQTFGYVLSKVLSYLQWLIFARAIFSFFVRDPSNSIYQFLVALTEPIIGPIRRLLPVQTMGMDFSPLIAIILLDILSRLVQ